MSFVKFGEISATFLQKSFMAHSLSLSFLEPYMLDLLVLSWRSLRYYSLFILQYFFLSDLQIEYFLLIYLQIHRYFIIYKVIEWKFYFRYTFSVIELPFGSWISFLFWDFFIFIHFEYIFSYVLEAQSSNSCFKIPVSNSNIWFILELISIDWLLDYIFLFLHMSSNLRYYPGHSEWYTLEMIWSVMFL